MTIQDETGGELGRRFRNFFGGEEEKEEETVRQQSEQPTPQDIQKEAEESVIIVIDPENVFIHVGHPTLFDDNTLVKYAKSGCTIKTITISEYRKSGLVLYEKTPLATKSLDELEAKDKEIERLKSFAKEQYQKGFEDGGYQQRQKHRLYP